MRPLRAAFLWSTAGHGGGETSLSRLLGAFDRTRLVPILLCPGEGPLLTTVRACGVEAVVVPWRPARRFFLPALTARSASTAAVTRALAALGPDIVYTDFHALPFAVSAAADLACPTVFGCYGWWLRPLAWQRSFVNHGVRRVHTISSAVTRGLVGARPWIDPERIAEIPLGIDTTTFVPRPEERTDLRRGFGLPADADLVTMLGRYQPVKGHDVLLDAARRVLALRPSVHFAIGGDSPHGVAADERFRRTVHRRVAADSVLRDRVHLMGWVDRPQDLLAASDVVVCPSRFESFGLVHLEAMACAVPMVSTDRGGPTDTVADGTTGFLVSPGRPELLADRMLTLLARPELRRRMGEAGRARVTAGFSLDRYVERMTELLCASAAAE